MSWRNGYNHPVKRQNHHVFDHPFLRGQESTCKHCGIKITPLYDLPYFEYETKDGDYGDTQYEPYPDCIEKLKKQYSHDRKNKKAF